MTTLAAAFEKVGTMPRDATLWRAIALYMNNGGTYANALAMLNRAYKIGAEGRKAEVSEGDGRSGDAGMANVALPSPTYSAVTPNRSDHAIPAKLANAPLSGRTSFNPPRGLSAIAAVQSTVAKSLFDTILLPDGRSLRQVRWHECPSLAQKYRKLAHILTALHRHAIPTDQTIRLDAVMTETELAKVVAEAEEKNHA